jgi:hypothetical protein
MFNINVLNEVLQFNLFLNVTGTEIFRFLILCLYFRRKIDVSKVFIDKHSKYYVGVSSIGLRTVIFLFYMVTVAIRIFSFK